MWQHLRTNIQIICVKVCAPTLKMYPRAESNCYLRFRKPLLYPLRYRGLRAFSQNLHRFCPLFSIRGLGNNLLHTPNPLYLRYLERFCKSNLATMRQLLQKSCQNRRFCCDKCSDFFLFFKTRRARRISLPCGAQTRHRSYPRPGR